MTEPRSENIPHTFTVRYGRSVQRGVPDYQLGNIVSIMMRKNRKNKISVMIDGYVPCPRCAKLDDKEKQFDWYWCNDCQATGWVLESWEENKQRWKKG